MGEDKKSEVNVTGIRTKFKVTKLVRLPTHISLFKSQLAIPFLGHGSSKICHLKSKVKLMGKVKCLGQTMSPATFSMI